MSNYMILILFVISSTVILYCLDRVKMYIARNLFMVFMWVMYIIIPLMIAGKIFTQAEDKLLEQWPIEKDLISAFAKLNDGTFTIVAVVFIVTAIITLVATVILAVRAAKLILIIASFKKSAKSLFRTSKKVVKRFFRFTYCPKGQKIYIRFCKLLN